MLKYSSNFVRLTHKSLFQFSKKPNKIPKGFEKYKRDLPGQKERDFKFEMDGQSEELFSEKNDFVTRRLFVIGGLFLSLYYLYDKTFDIPINVSYEKFAQFVLPNAKSVEITSHQALITTHDNRRYKLMIGNPDAFLENLEVFQTNQNVPQSNLIKVTMGNTDTYSPIAKFVNGLIYNSLLLAGFYLLFYRKNGLLKRLMPQYKKNYSFEQKVTVKFNDVAGLEEAKNEVREFVEFLKNTQKFKDIGARIPRGALLTGPPGTGKTMLAKACAGESGVPFFYVSGSEFVEMYVGLGASRVRDLFKQAKAKSPSIIFIDEIDAVGKKRQVRAGNDEGENTLNQLLVEMDGFGTDTGVVVLAATNLPENLDPALTRPGRLDRTIDVQLPDIEGRKRIFMVHLKPLTLEPSKTLEEYATRLSTLTPGFSGADIANLCNEAAILAARQNKQFIESHDFEMASERVMAGLEKKNFLSIEEKRVVAFHESGHAIVSWFLKGGDPLLKLTIIPRSKGSLGYAQYLPNESSLLTKSELMDKICCILGGRMSEEYFFKKVTTGAYDDLQKAQRLANAIVTKYGMCDELQNIQFMEYEYQLSQSQQTREIVDKEIRKILKECTEKTKAIIDQHQDKLTLLANTLIEKESLDLNQLIELLGERPFPPKSNFKAFLESKRLKA